LAEAFAGIPGAYLGTKAALRGIWSGCIVTDKGTNSFINAKIVIKRALTIWASYHASPGAIVGKVGAIGLALAIWTSDR